LESYFFESPPSYKKDHPFTLKWAHNTFGIQPDAITAWEGELHPYFRDITEPAWDFKKPLKTITIMGLFQNISPRELVFLFLSFIDCMKDHFPDHIIGADARNSILMDHRSIGVSRLRTMKNRGLFYLNFFDVPNSSDDFISSIQELKLSGKAFAIELMQDFVKDMHDINSLTPSIKNP